MLPNFDADTKPAALRKNNYCYTAVIFQEVQGMQESEKPPCDCLTGMHDST
jgi:hypothetical protein